MHSVKEILLSRDLPSRPVMIVSDSVRFGHLRSTRGGKTGQRPLIQEPDGENTALCSKTPNPIFKT